MAWRRSDAAHGAGGCCGTRRPLIPRGGGGGAGDPGGDGPDGGPDGPQGFDIFSDIPVGDYGERGAPRPLTMQPKPPFDTKAAASELPRYDGRDKQVIWRKKVTNYVHGRRSDMAGTL